MELHLFHTALKGKLSAAGLQWVGISSQNSLLYRGGQLSAQLPLYPTSYEDYASFALVMFSSFLGHRTTHQASDDRGMKRFPWADEPKAHGAAFGMGRRLVDARALMHHVSLMAIHAAPPGGKNDSVLI